MTWFKVDDGFASHPKVDALGADQPIAVACWTLCGTACARDLTDGLVTQAALRRALAMWSARDQRRAADALVRVGLWVVDGENWRFHEWLAHQPSREEVLAERERKARNQRASRAKKRGDNAGTGQHVTGPVTGDMSGDATGDEAVSHHGPSRPVPIRSEERSETEAGASASSEFALQPDKPKRRRREAARAAPDVVEVFEHWRAAMGKTQAATLDADRVGRIRWAIDTYGADFAKRAIDGCARNPWNRGQNPGGKLYDDVTLIFRNASKIEGHAAEAGPAQTVGPSRNIATAETVDVDAIARDIAARNARLRTA